MPTQPGWEQEEEEAAATSGSSERVVVEKGKKDWKSMHHTV